jgi:hypothetical protein
LSGISKDPKCSISRSEFDSQIAFMRETFSRLQLRFPSLLVFDSADVLCGKEKCSVMEGGRSLYSYTSHLSDFGNSKVAIEFERWAQRRF